MGSIDLAILVLRLVLGVVFIVHGGQKLFGWMGGSGVKGVKGMMISLGCANPGLLAWMATLSEIGGGLLVLIGLLTPLAGALIISTMIVAIYTVHFKNGFLAGNRGYEYNLSLSAMALALVLTGAGRFSIDYVLGIARPLDQWPVWVAVVLVLVMLGGTIMTELSRKMNTAAPQQQATVSK